MHTRAIRDYKIPHNIHGLNDDKLKLNLILASNSRDVPLTAHTLQLQLISNNARITTHFNYHLSLLLSLLFHIYIKLFHLLLNNYIRNNKNERHPICIGRKQSTIHLRYKVHFIYKIPTINICVLRVFSATVGFTGVYNAVKYAPHFSPYLND